MKRLLILLSLVLLTVLTSAQKIVQDTVFYPATATLVVPDGTTVSNTANIAVLLDTVHPRHLKFLFQMSQVTQEFNYNIEFTDTTDNGKGTIYFLDKDAILVSDSLYKDIKEVPLWEKDSTGNYIVADYLYNEKQYVYTMYKLVMPIRGTPYDKLICVFRN